MKKIFHINLAKCFRGGEKQTLLLIKELEKTKQFEQFCVVRKNPEFISKLNKECKNVKIIQISKPYVFHIFKLQKADILHAHEVKGIQLSFFANLLFKIPYILTRRVNFNIKNNFFNKQIYLKATTCVSISKAVSFTIKKLLNQPFKSKIIQDAISNFSVSEKNMMKIKNRYKNKYLIGNIAALEDEKGQIHIINAARKLALKYPNFHFIFLGSGSKELEYKKVAKDLPNVTFVGFVDNVGDYIACFDLFVFPSLNEGLGSSLLDVAKQKVPIIASKVGGIKNLLTDEKTTIFLKNINDNDIAKQIVRIYEDKKLAQEISQNAYELSKNYTPKIMAENYKKLYESILD